MANPTDRGRGIGTSSPGTSGQASRQGGAGGVTEAAQQFASAATEQAQQAWDTAGRQARQLASTAGDAFGDFRGFLGRYPLAVFVAGVGIGFLLARLLEDRTTDVARRMSEASAR